MAWRDWNTDRYKEQNDFFFFWRGMIEKQSLLLEDTVTMLRYEVIIQ